MINNQIVTWTAFAILAMFAFMNYDYDVDVDNCVDVDIDMDQFCVRYFLFMALIR